MRLIATVIAAGLVLGAATAVLAASIPIVDGTFTGANNSQPVGWFEDSGDVRVFNNTVNKGTMISVEATTTYEARHNTTVSIEPTTTYILRFETGFEASNARDGDYQAQIGTWSGPGNGTFTPLRSSTAILTQTAANEYRFSSGGFLQSKAILNTPGTVSGDNLALRLNNPTNTGPWLGYDNVTLQAIPTLFRQDFDSPVVGGWTLGGSGSQTTGSGAATSGASKPRGHDLGSGNWFRQTGGSGTVSVTATGTLTQPAYLDGEATVLFDTHAFTSGTAGRIYDVAGYDGSTELFSVGFDMQQNLYVNGVLTADTAFDGLQWTNVEVTLHENTWDLTLTQYAPAGPGAGGSPITTVTGLGPVTESLVGLPYLNSGERLTSIILDGNAAGVDFEPLQFFDNVVVAGNPIPEPSTFLLAGSGLLALAGCAAGRRRKAR
jgi:hypothetical protein